MYESFYGLREKPFNLLPDPDYIYMSHGHKNTYTHLEYAISENKGFVVITGEIGSGKTTLINFLLKKIQQDIQVAVVNQTGVSPTQLIRLICEEFELDVKGIVDKTEMLEIFNLFLLTQFSFKKRVVLIIDEAQNLPPKALEEIRMLSNLESEKDHLIQIILVGQPELKNKLQGKDLEQFAQRVTVNCHLDGLNKDEIEQYIRHRLSIGGTKNLDIFDKGAARAVCTYSRGIPRLINILCDTALVYGYADNLKVINKKVIQDVINSREAGGIFASSPKDKADGPVLNPSVETPISESLQGRLQMMERKIDAFENMVGSMDQRLTALVRKRDERDTIILELFKMLKASMESRLNILVKFSQYRKRMEAVQSEVVEKETAPHSSRYSWLKKRGKNKN